MKSLVTLALLAGSILLSGTSTAHAQVKKSDSVVKISSAAEKPDAEGNQTVSITLDIEKPWHLYANPVGLDLFAPVQTTIKFPMTVETIKITYPEGKLIKDSVTGDSYRIYEGKVTIKAQVKRPRGDSGPLDYSLTLQACSDKTCLLKATVKKTVP